MSMKVYDKEMYNKQESLKTTIIFILVFLLGFFAGYITSAFTIETAKEEKNNSNNYVIDNKIN